MVVRAHVVRLPSWMRNRGAESIVIDEQYVLRSIEPHAHVVLVEGVEVGILRNTFQEGFESGHHLELYGGHELVFPESK